MQPRIRPALRLEKPVPAFPAGLVAQAIPRIPPKSTPALVRPRKLWCSPASSPASSVRQWRVRPTFGTGAIPDDRFTELVRENFSLTPRGIIDALNLRRPIYRKTAAFGHFGRTEEGFTWEVADKAEALKESAAAVHATAR